MPGVMATLTDVNVNQTTGSITFVFADGGLQFSSIEQILEQLTFDTDPDFPKKLLILKAIRNSPDGANLSTMVGGTATADFNAATPIIITPPPG